jgi:hypothetical protein
MVHTLNDNGANSIWEHSLLDPSNSKISRRKPQAKDSLQLVDIWLINHNKFCWYRIYACIAVKLLYTLIFLE